MKIDLQIKRLVFENLPKEFDHNSVVKTAIKDELESLLMQDRVPDIENKSDLSCLEGLNIQLTGTEDAWQLGKLVAEEIYRRIKKNYEGVI